MKNIKDEAQRWVQFITFAAIWIALIYLNQSNLAINLEAIKTIPHAITIYAIIALLFLKWGWRLRMFRGWLVPFPDLQGTWEGTLKSTWVGPTGGLPVAPIPATLVIRQSFSTVSCVLYTAESESFSTAAQINDETGGLLRLYYNYTNRPRPSVRDRSEIHEGAAVLTIGESPVLNLNGEYWTGRKTTGEMSFKFKSRTLTNLHSNSPAV